jgi:hypothetical protein
MLTMMVKTAMMSENSMVLQKLGSLNTF